MRCLAAADALGHGRLRHEEGPGDLGGRQAADGPVERIERQQRRAAASPWRRIIDDAERSLRRRGN
jgi:hypothetical protein